MLLTGIVLLGSAFSGVQNKLTTASLQRVLADEALEQSKQALMPVNLTEHPFEVEIVLLENGTHVIRYFHRQNPEKTQYRFLHLLVKDSDGSFDNTSEIDSIADAILAEIAEPGMSQRDTAGAIYQWIRGNIAYMAYANDSDWVQAAYDGYIKRRGDCFVFYAAAKHLLTRAGIENQRIDHTLGSHAWNLVRIDGDWYHFDTTPRRTGGDFFLLTDAELAAYAEKNGGSHVWDTALYPAATGNHMVRGELDVE